MNGTVDTLNAHRGDRGTQAAPGDADMAIIPPQVLQQQVASQSAVGPTERSPRLGVSSPGAPYQGGPAPTSPRARQS